MCFFLFLQSSNLTPASRMLASGSRSTSNYNNNKDNSSTTGATASVNSHSHSNNSDDASRAAQTAALDTALVGTDAMFCSLVDSIFLIGPSAQSVLDQIAAHTVVQHQEPMEKDKEGAQMKRAASQAPLKDGISPNVSFLCLLVVWIIFTTSILQTFFHERLFNFVCYAFLAGFGAEWLHHQHYGARFQCSASLHDAVRHREPLST